MINMIHSTGKAGYYSWFVDISDDSFCKIDVEQYLSEKRQNKLPQLKHCTKRVILRSYRCTTLAHSKKYFFTGINLNSLKSLIWGRYIYTRTKQNTMDETITKGTSSK